MIKDLIYSFIIGDSYGLSILDNETDNSDIKLKFNKTLNIEKGYFSFFTTNLLATIDSISTNKNIAIKDILNKLVLSLIVGKYTNDGTVRKADIETLNILEYYSKKNNLYYNYNNNDLNSNPISRVLPITIYNYYNTDTLDTLIPVVSLTTNNEVVLLGCFIYYKYLLNLINGYDKYKSLKIYIPDYFNNETKKIYKNILKGNIYYKDITFDDNIINVLKIVFYVILNSDNMNDVLLILSNLSGCTNIYSSLTLVLASFIYGFDSIPNTLKKDLKNKKEINKYIKEFERIFI